MVPGIWGRATMGKTIFSCVDIGGKSLKLFFSRTSWPISIKIDTNPLVKGIQNVTLVSWTSSSSKRR
jgi:hypothetical protein